VANGQYFVQLACDHPAAPLFVVVRAAGTSAGRWPALTLTDELVATSRS
jgi:hypothetical protein